jgi:hypothetical protein
MQRRAEVNLLEGKRLGSTNSAIYSHDCRRFCSSTTSTVRNGLGAYTNREAPIPR